MFGMITLLDKETRKIVGNFNEDGLTRNDIFSPEWKRSEFKSDNKLTVCLVH